MNHRYKLYLQLTFDHYFVIDKLLEKIVKEIKIPIQGGLDPKILLTDKEILKKELNQKRFIKNTRKGGNEIYIINGNNSPNTMNEIGRLREKTFRLAGGGTGESIDVDAADFGKHCYEQLIVWSPEDEEIIGGYRFICCEKAIDKEENKIHLSTANYFNFSDNFIKNYIPHTIELGRSWIQPNFQGTNNARKGLFALDNIWDGLGALIQLNPN